MIKQLIILSSMFVLASCGYFGSSSHVTESSPVPTFTNLKTSVFASKCTQCHSGRSPSGGYDLSNYEKIMAGGRVIPFEPGQSILVQRLRDGSMPPTGKLGENEIVAIEDWIKAGAHGEGVENLPPVVTAGSDQTITLPMKSFSIFGTAVDADGSIVKYAWSKITGPNVTLVGANTQILTINNIAVGTYVFELTATDNKGASGSDRVTVTVNGASTGGTPTPTPKPTATPASTPAPSSATFTYISANILNNQCVRCHGSFKSYSGTMNYVSAGKASSSKLFTEVNSGAMPRGSSKLTAVQIDLIKTWINSGAQNN